MGQIKDSEVEGNFITYPDNETYDPYANADEDRVADQNVLQEAVWLGYTLHSSVLQKAHVQDGNRVDRVVKRAPHNASRQSEWPVAEYVHHVIKWQIKEPDHELDHGMGHENLVEDCFGNASKVDEQKGGQVGYYDTSA